MRVDEVREKSTDDLREELDESYRRTDEPPVSVE